MAEKASVKLNCYKCKYGLELISSIDDWTAKMKELSGKEISVLVGSTDWHSGWNEMHKVS